MELTTAYVFLVKRPKDHKAWPSVYHDKELALAAPNRVSAIAEVSFTEEGQIIEPAFQMLRSQFDELQGRLDEARGQVAKLQEQLGAQMGHEQNIAAKWRKLVEDVNTELRLRAKAKLSSACSCPIGVCLEWGGVKQDGACWFQWAEGHILKRAGELRIDFLRQMACHPARVAAIAQGHGDEPLNPGG